jgi:hypothetical protein
MSNDNESREREAKGAEYDAKVLDCLRWVAQEANGAVMGGMVELREPNKLREALAALHRAYESPIRKKDRA